MLDENSDSCQEVESDSENDKIIPPPLIISTPPRRDYTRIDPTFVHRKVQVEAIDAYFKSDKRRIIISLPTGTGKTLTGLTIAGRIAGRVLWLAHREELISQPAKDIDKHFPGLKYGIERGQIATGDRARIVIATTQSLADVSRLQRIMENGGPFDLVVYDECHHAPSQGARKLLGRLGCFREDEGGPHLLGLTATINRTDRVSLNEIFEDVVYKCSIKRAIDEGYLVPPTPIKVKLPINPKAIRVVNGDLDQADLEEELVRTNAAQATATAIHAHCHGRKTIVFCVSVNQAKRTAQYCKEIGLKAEWVAGSESQDPLARSKNVKAFSDGNIQILTCAMLLSEGYDEPRIGAVVMARPTKSQTLYIQSAGRGLRTAEGKTDCLLIDLAGASDLGLITPDVLFDTEDDEDKKPKKKRKSKKDSESGGEANTEWQKISSYLRSASTKFFDHDGISFAEATDDLVITVAKDRDLVLIERSKKGEDLWIIKHKGSVFTPFALSRLEALTVCKSIMAEFGGPVPPNSPEWNQVANEGQAKKVLPLSFAHIKISSSLSEDEKGIRNLFSRIESILSDGLAFLINPPQDEENSNMGIWGWTKTKNGKLAYDQNSQSFGLFSSMKVWLNSEKLDFLSKSVDVSQKTLSSCFEKVSMTLISSENILGKNNTWWTMRRDKFEELLMEARESRIKTINTTIKSDQKDISTIEVDIKPKNESTSSPYQSTMFN